jgi:lactam utilization protein B
MSARDLEYMIAYQIGALQGIAAGVGERVTHVKPHGAARAPRRVISAPSWETHYEDPCAT